MRINKLIKILPRNYIHFIIKHSIWISVDDCIDNLVLFSVLNPIKEVVKEVTRK